MVDQVTVELFKDRRLMIDALSGKSAAALNLRLLLFTFHQDEYGNECLGFVREIRSADDAVDSFINNDHPGLIPDVAMLVVGTEFNQTCLLRLYTDWFYENDDDGKRTTILRGETVWGDGTNFYDEQLKRLATIRYQREETAIASGFTGFKGNEIEFDGDERFHAYLTRRFD